MKNFGQSRYLVREITGLVVMAASLFWSAGQLAWWQAWAALGVMILWTAATAVIVTRINPALLAERLGPVRGSKAWDAAIVGILGLTSWLRYITAGLDQRFGWTGELPLAVQIAALAFCLLGYSLFTWATASNAFFSQVVRIQTDRGHSVCCTGPYRLVRHPAYLGAILYELSVALLLSSWWALGLGMVNAGLLVYRTAREDLTLRAELAGFEDYGRRVPFRLIPGLW